MRSEGCSQEFFLRQELLGSEVSPGLNLSHEIQFQKCFIWWVSVSGAMLNPPYIPIIIYFSGQCYGNSHYYSNFLEWEIEAQRGKDA